MATMKRASRTSIAPMAFPWVQAMQVDARQVLPVDRVARAVIVGQADDGGAAVVGVPVGRADRAALLRAAAEIAKQD